MAEKGFGVKEINLIGASGTPTIESPNNLNLNAVNVAISTNATIGGNLTVSGTVGIAGTLTYEDVTNIDAIGIITARNGVNLTGGNLSLGDSGGSSDDRISIGAGGDINIYHNGTDSYVSNATGDLRLFSVGGSADDVLIRAQDDIELQPNNGQSGVKVIGTGAVELYHNNSKKLETSSSGATVTGTLAATAVTGDGSGLTNLPATDPTNTDVQVVYTVTANGSSAYRFGGNGIVSTADNPDVYLIRGFKYRFINNSGGSHPFQIRQSSGGSAYNGGVTNNGASSGNIDFQVPYSAPSHLYYQCTNHGGMVGNLYIRGAGGQNTNVGLTTFSSDVILDSGDITVSHTGLAVNIFESTNNHSRLRIKSADASLAQLEFADQSDADAGEIRYDHGNDRMTFHVGANNERLRLDQYGYATLDSGSQGNNSKPGIELKSSGYTGNITKLFQDSPNGESYLQTTERPLIIDVDSTNGTSSSRLQVNIDGDEKVRITSDGYILTAQQVGCAVRMSSNFTHPGNANFNQGSNWVMPFDTEVWDIGGNFNTSNYTFTAPVAGRYLCCYTIQLESISNWLWNYIYPVVTGTGGTTNTVASAAAGVVFSDDAGNGVTGNSTTTAQYHTFTNTVVMNLTAGQAVRMGVRGNMTATIKSGAESQWTMQLLG